MFGNDDIFFPSQIRLCCWWLTYISQEISLLGCKLPLLLWQMKVLFSRDPQGKTYENWSFILALGLGDPYDSFPRYRLLVIMLKGTDCSCDLEHPKKYPSRETLKHMPQKRESRKKSFRHRLKSGVDICDRFQGRYLPFSGKFATLDREFPVPLGQSLGQQLPPPAASLRRRVLNPQNLCVLQGFLCEVRGDAYKIQ